MPIPRGTGHYRLFTQFAYWNYNENTWTYTGWFPETFNKQTPTYSMWSNYCTA